MGVFERYLSVWVAAAIAIGVTLVGVGLFLDGKLFNFKSALHVFLPFSVAL